MIESTGNLPHRSRSNPWRADCSETGTVGSGAGRAEKGQHTTLVPRRAAEPTRTVREQFLVELTGEPDQTGRHLVGDLLELNRLFTAWVETVYHRQIHSETGQAPLVRWAAGGPLPLPTPATLAEAFLWEERRTVTKTATVSLHGNVYQVDELLVGRRVELVFDPFDLPTIAVRVAGVPAGTAVPHHIGRHAHPKARPETPATPPPATGIDYARLLDATHQAELAGKVNYAALANPSADTQPAEHGIDEP